MKKRFKKFMALVMAATLLCSSMTVFAADETTSPAKGSASGNAQLEGWVEKEVFCVSLPTTPVNTNVFSFRLDPQDLFQQASGNSLSIDKDKVTGDLLYFTNHDASGNATGLSASSDALKAVNKGSVDVNVSLSAKISDLGSIALASDTAALASADAASIYVAIASTGLKDASGNAVASPVAITGSGASAEVKGVLGAASGDAYEIIYTSGNASGNGYKYQLTEEAKAADYAGFEEVVFQLVGACNSADDVDWAGSKDETPSIDVVWELTSAAGPSYFSASSVSASSPSVIVTFPEGATGFTSVTLVKPNGDIKVLTANNLYTYTSATKTLALKDTVISSNRGGTVKVVFNDSSATEASFTIN